MVFIVFGRVLVEVCAHELILRRHDFDQRNASVAFWLGLTLSVLAILSVVLLASPVIETMD